MKYRSRIYYPDTDKALMWDRWQKGDSVAMFTEIYIEALLVDEDAADHVWEAWDMGPAQRTISSVES